MPTFDFTSPEGKTYSVEGPDGATPEQAFFILQQHLGQPATPKIGTAQDIVQSAPNSALQGLGDFAKFGSMMIDPGAELGPLVGGPDAGTLAHQNAATIANAVDKGIAATGLPGPQTMGGRIVGGGVRSVTNPLSYIGPGGPLLKAGGAALSGIGSEAAGEAAQGTGYELPARIAGSVAGGAAAAKALGPKQAVAAIPTQAELKAAATEGYNAARDSGLKIQPQAVKDFATAAEQELINEGHDSQRITGFLQNLQRAPEGSVATSQNLDAMRKYLGRVSRETQPGDAPGQVKPTPDAAAASLVLDRFKNFTENIPESAVVAGNPDAYATALKPANANYAASQRVGNFDFRLNKAENAAERNVAGSVANQIRSKVGGALDNPKALRGLTPDEISQIENINGNFSASNILPNLMRQWGRGGAAHVIPIGMQLSAAAKTGGASIPIWASMVAARLGDNALTKARAQTLIDTLAKRSPLYAERLKALSTPNMVPNQAQVFRSTVSPLTMMSPLRRTILQVGRSGRPIKTAPFNTAATNDIVNAAYANATGEALSRPYKNVPNNLMGFSRNGPAKGFDNENYKYVQNVLVDLGNGNKFIDAIKGLNKPHALERAYRNWGTAKITPISAESARKLTEQGLYQ